MQPVTNISKVNLAHRSKQMSDRNNISFKIQMPIELVNQFRLDRVSVNDHCPVSTVRFKKTIEKLSLLLFFFKAMRQPIAKCFRRLHLPMEINIK